jgi:glycosyl transferase family 87
MRHFFTEDVSPDNHPVVELQRRACWVGLALITLSLSQIMNAPTIFKDLPAIFILVRCLAFCVLLLSFVIAWMALRPGTLQEETKHLHRHPRRWQRVALVSTLLLSIGGGVLCVLTIVDCFLPPIFSNDGTSLDTNAADLLTQGRNPYTDSSMLDVARQFQIQADWTTPLRQGKFAGRLDYPTFTELQTVLDKDLKAGNAPEFESKVSYPALSFLTLVPFTWFKDYNVLPLYFLSYLLLIAIAWKVARPELRPWVLLLAMTNVPMWSSTYGGNLDIFYVLLIVIAWLLRAHRWRSALFLGLAIATKQIAWFFIPFYLIMTWRHCCHPERSEGSGSPDAEILRCAQDDRLYGLAESVRRLAIAGCVFLIFNLPFMLWNAQAWLAGVLAPVADPMFPVGLGLIELSVNHVLPYFPSWLYGMLEGVAMLVALAWYWRLCRKRPEAAMLLAFLPLVFAWRSLPSYFFCSIYPAFILMAAKARRATRTTIKADSTHPNSARPYGLSFNGNASSEQAAQSRPAPVGMLTSAINRLSTISIAHFFCNMAAKARRAYLSPRQGAIKAHPAAPHPARPYGLFFPASWSEHEDDEPAVQGG